MAILLCTLVSSMTLAQEPSLSNPSIKVLRIEIADFLPVGPNTPKESDVFVIEFSSTADLREWSKTLKALILPDFSLCADNVSLPDDNYFIADFKGMIGDSGAIVVIPKMPLPTEANRYTTFAFRNQTSGDATLHLEDLSGDLCMRLGVAASDLPRQQTKALMIPADILRKAWSIFEKR